MPSNQKRMLTYAVPGCPRLALNTI